MFAWAGERVTQPNEGREVLEFFAAALCGPILLGAVLALTRGFNASTLMLALSGLFFATGPGVLLGLPVYYAIRKVRVPGRWVTAAFGAAVSGMPITALFALGVGMPPGIAELGRILVTAVIATGSAFCGAIGGFMFWTIVFRTVAVAQRS